MRYATARTIQIIILNASCFRLWDANRDVKPNRFEKKLETFRQNLGDVTRQLFNVVHIEGGGATNPRRNWRWFPSHINIVQPLP